MKLYSDMTRVCHLFYVQYFPHQKIADKLERLLKKRGANTILFIGGLAYVAKKLKQKNYDVTLLEYTPEMLKEAKAILGGSKFVLGDMRDLKVGKKFDAVVAMGRSFTYMASDQEALAALGSFERHLNPGGVVIMDNYETGLMERGAYFNGTIKTGLDGVEVRRISTIKLQRKRPSLYLWDCVYELREQDGIQRFEDKGHGLRSFSKSEIEKLIAKSGLVFVAHHGNFERRSFISVAIKQKATSA